jgi:hypothetical protein
MRHQVETLVFLYFYHRYQGFLHNASEEYTAKLELNTAEGEAYRTRLDIGNIFKQGGTADEVLTLWRFCFE